MGMGPRDGLWEQPKLIMPGHVQVLTLVLVVKLLELVAGNCVSCAELLFTLYH